MIVTINELEKIRKEYLKKRIVILKGSFDLLHTGHIYMMEEAKKNGDILLVIVKPDLAIKIKGNDRPIISEIDRVKMVDSIKYVDYTILANQFVEELENKDIKELQTTRYCEIVNKLKPDILVTPKNHKNPEQLDKLYKELNVEIIEIERDKTKPSTTKILNKIRNN